MARMIRMSLLLLLLIACACFHAVCAASIRGLDPRYASHYTGADGTFICLDGSQRIDFSRVNDNYCDCFDGSDEPGTSACYNGRFHCANKGHEPQLLAASFVDDGICDCCDGSDDKGCPHTCLDKSMGLVKKLELLSETYQSALTSKLTAIQAAAARRAAWPTRRDELVAEVAAKDAEVKAAAEAKAKLDQLVQEKQAADQKAREEEQARLLAEQEEQARKLAEEQAANPEPEQAQPQEETTEQQEADAHEGETVEERGRRIASQWTTDPHAAAAGEGSDDEEGAHEDEDSLPYEHEEPHHEEYDELGRQASEAKRQLEAAEAQLEALKKEQQDISFYSSGTHDFGPNDEFFPLAGRCFEERSGAWVYEVCFFDRAYQSESSGNKVSLGSWKGFSEDHTVAEFDNGDPCPSVPGRSLRVHLVCGEDEQLHDASEPSTCQYEVTLDTPLACSDAEHAQITQRLIELQLQRKQLQDEINAEHDEL